MLEFCISGINYFDKQFILSELSQGMEMRPYHASVWTNDRCKTLSRESRNDLILGESNDEIRPTAFRLQFGVRSPIRTESMFSRGKVAGRVRRGTDYAVSSDNRRTDVAKNCAKLIIYEVNVKPPPGRSKLTIPSLGNWEQSELEEGLPRISNRVADSFKYSIFYESQGKTNGGLSR